MFVRNTMIEEITTVAPDSTLKQAYEVIRAMHYDCLPVLGERKVLVGLITMSDVYEACMQHGRESAFAMLVQDVMTTKLITVSPEDLIERAAKVMYQRDVSSLPVVDAGELKGIINAADLFGNFAQMMGVDSGTVRLTLVVPERKGQLARIAEIIRNAGLTITHIATFPSQVFDQYRVVVRVESDSSRQLVDLLDSHGYKVIHVDID